MVYVLIVMFSLGYGGRTTLVMQEFTSADRCSSAQAAITANKDFSYLKTLCVPK